MELAQLGDPLVAPRGHDHLGWLAPTRAEQAGEEGLSDPSAAEDRDLAAHTGSLGGSRSRQRDQAATEAGEEIDAGEAGPLAVRLEQLGRLPRLHCLPPAERSHELDQPEISDKPVLEAAEPLEADDASRPRTQAALARDPAHDNIGWQVVEPLELEAAAEPDDSRATPLVQPQPAQLERRDGSSAAVVGGSQRPVTGTVTEG